MAHPGYGRRDTLPQPPATTTNPFGRNLAVVDLARRRRQPLGAVAIILVGTLAFAACGGEGDAAASGPTTTESTATTLVQRAVSAVTPATASTVPAPPPAPGTFVTAPGTSWPAGTGAPRTYTVEVETATGVDPTEFATFVDATLSDPRSWIADGSLSVQRVEAGGSARIVLATPGTTNAMCAPLRTNGIYSCGQGSTAVINLDRWNNGIDVWTGPLEEYRHYVVNHEFGHVLGHGHDMCGGAGQPAPVMQQQTKGLDGCLPNGWPYP